MGIFSLLWKVPVTLLTLSLCFTYLMNTLDDRSEDQVIVEKLATLVEQHSEYLSNNKNAGLKIQSVQLDDDYWIFSEGTKYERYVFSFNLSDDPNIATRELHSTSVPGDFGDIPLYRLADDLSIYAIDPPAQYKQVKDESTGIGSVIFALFILIGGIGFTLSIWVKPAEPQAS